MNEHNRDCRFPRAPLFGAFALVIFSLVLAAVGRFTGIGTAEVGQANPLEVRELRFEDRNDGSVVVLDASNGTVIEVLAPGTNGFVRGLMRGLVRERKMEGIGDQPPFRLIRFDDGRLSLTDTATGRQIELISFGHTQVEVFARLLRAGTDPKNFASVNEAEDK